MSEVKQKVLDVIAANQPLVAALATVGEDGRPRVRYVVPHVADDLTMTVATWLKSKKVADVRAHPEVHLTCGSTDMETSGNYLQIEARAEVSTDPEKKRAHWSDGLSTYFEGVDDPNYALLIITPYRITVHGMTTMEASVWKA